MLFYLILRPSWTRKANQFSYLLCSSKISIKKFPLKFTIPTLNLNSSKMENLTEINSAIKLNNFVFIKQSKNEMNKKNPPSFYHQFRSNIKIIKLSKKKICNGNLTMKNH